MPERQQSVGSVKWSPGRKTRLDIHAQVSKDPELVSFLRAIEPDYLIEPFDLAEHLVNEYRNGTLWQLGFLLAPEINPGLICIEAGLVVEGRIGNTDDGG